MTRVTAEFDLPGPVPFLDVHVDHDNPLFLDPSVLRNHRTDRRAARAHDLVLDFFTEVLRCRRSGSRADAYKGKRILKVLHEPNEARLGYSAGAGPRHASGDEPAVRLWNTLGTNPACARAVLTRLEDVPLFIPHVAEDLISDLTTRIVYEVLADFTKRMMGIYPTLAASAVASTVPIWDPVDHNWHPRTVSLPHTHGHQLLLIPKTWIFGRLLMQPDSFYNQPATRTIQQEQTTYDPRGKATKPIKDAIEQAHADLVAQYRTWVDREYRPLTEPEIDSLLG